MKSMDRASVDKQDVRQMTDIEYGGAQGDCSQPDRTGSAVQQMRRDVGATARFGRTALL